MSRFKITSEIREWRQTLYAAAGETKTTCYCPRKQPLNSVKHVSMLSDGVSREGGVLQKWKSPYQAIVLSSLMENGRAAQARAHPTISLASAQAAVPSLQHSRVSLPHTPRSFITHKPPSFNFTSQSLYRSLWTLFCSSVLFSVTISLPVLSLSLSLSLALSLRILLTLGRMQCATPWATSEDNLHWSICQIVPPLRVWLLKCQGELSSRAAKLVLCGRETE